MVDPVPWKPILTEAQVAELWMEFDAIADSVTYPTFGYIGVSLYGVIVRKTDNTAIAEYFRNNDFSDELEEMRALYARIGVGRPSDTKIFAITRVRMWVVLEILTPLIAFRNTFGEQPAQELSGEDRGRIALLMLIRDDEQPLDPKEFFPD
jgi:hypothetical protein